MSNVVRFPICPPHRWDADGERCEKCGEKDWMIPATHDPFTGEPLDDDTGQKITSK